MENTTMAFSFILKSLRKEFNITQAELAEKLGVVRSAIANYETNRTMPDPTTLNALAKIFSVSVDYLLGNTTERTIANTECPKITKKDERDISARLAQIRNDLESQQGLMLYNNELDEETKEFLIASLERTMKQSKILAKEKFTPKKYKK